MPTRSVLLENLFSGEIVAVVLAVVLVLINVAALPRSERRVARLPIGFLVLHLFLYSASRLWESESRLHQLLVVGAVLFLLAAIGRGFVILVFEVGLGRRGRTPLPRIIRDLAQAVVYLAVFITALRGAGFDPGSLLTTSALLTAVIGLSLQETLGNVFAGLAIQLQRPFDVGDWVQFDADKQHVGKVLEIGWRATKVLTSDDVEIMVPNGALAKEPISNFSKPSTMSRRAVYVTLPCNLPPRRAHQILADAIHGAWGVLESPEVRIFTHNFADSGIEYCARFWTEEFHKREIVDGGVRDRIWYALSRAGVELVYPVREVYLHQDTEEKKQKKAAEVADERLTDLRGVDFLAILPDEELRVLADGTRQRLYAAGETIVKRGDRTTDLFVVHSGKVSVVVPGKKGEDARHVATIEAGHFFGEMALMTGEPRRATIVAVDDSELYVIGRTELHSVLASHPEFAEEMARIIAERQAALDETESRTDRDSVVDERTSQIFDKVRKFFSI
ncbi:hypothetical protein BH09MYX1_BH09MYX1_39210 [soil metagenome]